MGSDGLRQGFNKPPARRDSRVMISSQMSQQNQTITLKSIWNCTQAFVFPHFEAFSFPRCDINVTERRRPSASYQTDI